MVPNLYILQILNNMINIDLKLLEKINLKHSITTYLGKMPKMKFSKIISKSKNQC